MSKKVFIIPDIHYEVRDKRAIEVALAAQRQFEPDITIILGDMLNCEAFTGHRKKRVKEAIGYNWIDKEFEPAMKLLDEIQSQSKHTVYLEGNHEAWIEKFFAGLGAVAGAFDEWVSLSAHIKANRKDFEFIPYVQGDKGKNSAYKLHRDLYAVHGWSCCKHASAKHLELSRTKSIIFGHTHRMESRVSRCPWSGKEIQSRSFGCLCQLQPVYMVGGSPTEWTHGFGVGFMGTKSFTMYEVPIRKNCCVLPDGTEVKV